MAATAVVVCLASAAGWIFFRQDRKEFSKALFPTLAAAALTAVLLVAQFLSPGTQSPPGGKAAAREHDKPASGALPAPGRTDRPAAEPAEDLAPGRRTWALCQGVDSLPATEGLGARPPATLTATVEGATLTEEERALLGARLRSLLRQSRLTGAGTIQLSATLTDDSAAYPAPTASVVVDGEFRVGARNGRVPFSESVDAVGETAAAARRNAVSCAAAAAAAQIVALQQSAG